MHVLEYLHRNVKTVAMPTAMVVGALLCRPVTALEGWTHQMITPSLIFLMLFVTFCRVKPRQMKPSMLHFWLLLFQVVVSVAVYFLLLPLNPIVAQGAMICVLAPVAMAAVVIAGMLGANVPTMATYSLVCNMVIALVAPVVLSLAGTGAMLLHADTGAYRAAAHHALRGCAVLPFRTARSGEMDRGSQSDFILHVARIAGGDHRPYDGLYPRFARCFARDRAVAGIRGAGNLPGAVQGRPLARPPLRRRSGGRAVARAEKHGAGRLDGAVVPRPDLLDRPDGIYCLAELRQFLPDMEKDKESRIN